MECEYKVSGTELRIVLPRELDHHVATQIQQETDLLVDTYHIRRIIFDFRGTDFMDSSRDRCNSGAFSECQILRRDNSGGKYESEGEKAAGDVGADVYYGRGAGLIKNGFENRKARMERFNGNGYEF